MRRPALALILGIVTVAVFGAAAVDAAGSGDTESPRTKLTLVAPAAPGGGWDAFAREAQQGLRTNGIANNVQVVNVPGAAGTIGLNQVAEMEGRHDLMLVTGGVMVGGVILNDSKATLADTVPIARLADDYNVLVVPADAPYDTLAEFVEDWRADPGGTSIAGGSLGGIDHLLSGMLGDTIGLSPSAVNYIPFPGGGEAVTALLSHSATAGLSGLNDFRDQIDAGNLKALGVSAAEPRADLDIPTFVEQGVDVSMANWRGLVAPPGIDDATRDELVAMAAELRETPEWADTLARNNWTDSFMTGDEFAAFIAEEDAMTRTIIEEFGL